MEVEVRWPKDKGLPGTLHLRTVSGHFTARPETGKVICFGREESQVHLLFGSDDTYVSRVHGRLEFRQQQWWLRNTGKRLMCLPPGRLMHSSNKAVPLAPGYTAVLVKGGEGREHLAEMYVSGLGDVRALTGSEPTVPQNIEPLDDDERLLLVVIGQDYLRYDQNPRPWTYSQAAALLSDLRPEGGWDEKAIQRKVAAVRHRVPPENYPGPVTHPRESGRRPADNRYLHNLLKGLVQSTTLIPPDLKLIDEEPW